MALAGQPVVRAVAQRQNLLGGPRRVRQGGTTPERERGRQDEDARRPHRASRARENAVSERSRGSDIDHARAREIQVLDKFGF